MGESAKAFYSTEDEAGESQIMVLGDEKFPTWQGIDSKD